MKTTGRLFLSKRFLLVIPLIAQSVFAEAIFFTFQGKQSEKEFNAHIKPSQYFDTPR